VNLCSALHSVKTAIGPILYATLLIIYNSSNNAAIQFGPSVSGPAFSGDPPAVVDQDRRRAARVLAKLDSLVNVS